MPLYPWGDSRPFYSYKQFLQKRFGGRLQKLTIDAGFTCPNRDGKIATGGCTYCLNDAFNPSYCDARESVTRQMDKGIAFHQTRYARALGYIAYFQAFSNTYAPLSRLREIYEPALKHPLIKGIVVGTRPDCMDTEKLDYFETLSRQCFVSIEYGVESIRDVTLQRVRRGHTFGQAAETIALTAARQIHTGIHLIFGLPGETPEDWFNDLHTLNALPLSSLKFHQLQIIKGTSMAMDFREHPADFHVFSLEEYVDFMARYLTELNPAFVVERLAGEVPPRFLETNLWGLTRYDTVLQKIEQKLQENQWWQGKNYKAI